MRGLCQDAGRQLFCSDCESTFMTSSQTPSPSSSVLPSLPDALQTAFDQAVSTHRGGDPVQALATYRQVLDVVPTHAEARYLLAVALFQTGKQDEAEEEARQTVVEARTARAPGLMARALNLQGNILAAKGAPQKALDAFLAAENANPTAIDGAFNAATILVSLNRPDEAVPLLKRVLHHVPHHVGALNNLGAALVKAGCYEEAATHYARALDAVRAQGGDGTDLGINLASALELVNRVDEAVAALIDVENHCAQSGQPVPPTVLVVRSRLRRRQGDLDGAIADCQAALGQSLSPVDRIEVLFSLGLAEDQRQHAGEAFDAFRKGNALVAEQPAARQYDQGAYLRKVERTRSWFTPHRMAMLGRWGDLSTHGENVVFFVGFPRSGTTLMEQVLEAHPKLVTTMEASPLMRVRERLGMSYPDMVDRLNGQAGDRLRKAFFEAVGEVVGSLGERTVVDKLPLNIINLGLAQALFPKARVLVALRDPRDCVLSCFMQNFRPNEAMINFLDLQQAAQTYAAVMSLFQEQRAMLSMPLHTYRYEDLITDFTPTVEAVLDFLGVGWDPAVEQYREKAQQRTIVTPSYRDVTAPLFTRAMERWRQYADQLAPVLPTLAPFAEAFGYARD